MYIRDPIFFKRPTEKIGIYEIETIYRVAYKFSFVLSLLAIYEFIYIQCFYVEALKSVAKLYQLYSAQNAREKVVLSKNLSFFSLNGNEKQISLARSLLRIRIYI